MTTTLNFKTVEEAIEDLQSATLTASKQAFEAWELVLRTQQQATESGVKALFSAFSTASKQ